MMIPVLMSKAMWAVSLVKLQRLVDFLLGLALGFSTRNGWKKDEVKAETEYDKSAHLVKLWLNTNSLALTTTDLDKYLMTHEAYVEPEFVLKHDHISIQGCNHEYVWFSVTPPELDIYDMSTFPFVSIPQTFCAQKMVIMKHWAFHRLASQLGDPKHEQFFMMHHLGRTGSTLLCQMFHKLPNTIVLADPITNSYVSIDYLRGRLSKAEAAKLMRNVIRLQGKPSVKKEHTRLMIKMVPCVGTLYGEVRKAFPRCQLFFSARHPASTIQSWNQSGSGLSDMIIGDIEGTFRYFNTFDRDDEKADKFLALKGRLPMGVEYSSCYVAGALARYLKQKDQYAACMIYEELMNNPQEEAEKFFRALDIPLELVPKTLTAMNKNSQNHLIFDPKKFTKLSADKFKEVDDIFRWSGLDFDTDVAYDDFKKMMALT